MDRSAALYDEGRVLMEAGDLAGAAARFEESSRLAPHFKTLELLGECYARSGRLRDAVVPLAAATTLKAGVRAPSLLAEVFLALGQRDDAAGMADLSLRRDPRNRRALAVRRALTEGEGA